MDLILLVLACCMFWGVRWLRGAPDTEGYLSRETSTGLKAVFAIVVILHHISQRAATGTVFPNFQYVGYLAVSVFFFLSGFGLVTQYRKRKQEYLRKFLLLRLPAVLFPYIIIAVFAYGFYNLMGTKYTASEALATFLTQRPIVTHSWYILAIFFFYLVFYLAAIVSKGRAPLLIALLFLGGVAYTAICTAREYGSWWYNSWFAFVFGAAWGCYKEKIDASAKKGYFVKLAAAVGVFVLFFYLSKDIKTLSFFGKTANTYYNLLCTQLSSVFFCAAFFLLSMKLRLKNRLLTYVGGISFEIYMVHGLIYNMLRSSSATVNSDWLWLVLTILISVQLAALFHRLFTVIMGAYKRLLSSAPAGNAPGRKKTA